MIKKKMHSGGILDYNKNGAKKGDPHSEYERREPCAIVQIIEILHTKGEEEDSQFIHIIEESLIPTQA
jgi:hypothetical protein